MFFIPKTYTLLFIISTSLALFRRLCLASDTISANQSLTISERLVSQNGEFELGFFNPGYLNHWYVGIWYRNIPSWTIVWVANRDDPVNGPNGMLRIADNKLVIYDSVNNEQVWSSNRSSNINMTNPVAKILDTGNFVLKEAAAAESVYVWQSFDYPTDTLLPDMKLGWDSLTGIDRYLRSWKSADDPSSGKYEFKLNHSGFPEIFLWRENMRIFRTGPWIGTRVSGLAEMNPSTILNFEFVSKSDEIYYKLVLRHKSILPSRLVLSSGGLVERFTWVEESKTWSPFGYVMKDQCDVFRLCGTWGICDTDSSPVCKCLTGSVPKTRKLGI
ncbi:unnamed protein product [Rhodiola kirilowii]